MSYRSFRSALPAVCAALVVALAIALVGRAMPAMADADSPKLPAPKIDVPKADAKGTQTAVLAGGCFWCMEAVFERLDGVTDVQSGFAGGEKSTATYEQVSGAGTTKHAESIKVIYDPAKITYGKLLQVLLTISHPTTKDGQYPDFGRQYRSAIFPQNAEQEKVATAYLQQLKDAKIFDKQIYTEVEPGKTFYEAEAYHQDYADMHPDNSYIQMYLPAKIKHLHEVFGGILKPKYQNEK